jgi:hypothetical protein
LRLGLWTSTPALGGLGLGRRSRSRRRSRRRLGDLLTPCCCSRLSRCLPLARSGLSCRLSLSLTFRIFAARRSLSLALLLPLSGGGGLLFALAGGLLLSLLLGLLTARLGFGLTGIPISRLLPLLLSCLTVALSLFPPGLGVTLTLGLGFAVRSSLLLTLALGGLLLRDAGALGLSLTLRLLACLLLLVLARLLLTPTVPIPAGSITVPTVAGRDGHGRRRIGVTPVLPTITAIITPARTAAITTIAARPVTPVIAPVVPSIIATIIDPVVPTIIPTVFTLFLTPLAAAFSLLPLTARFQFTPTPGVLLHAAALGLGGRLTQGSRSGQIATGIAAALAGEGAVQAATAGIIDDDQLAIVESIAVVRVADVVGLVLTGAVVVPALLAALEPFQIALAALIFPIDRFGGAIVVAVVGRRIAVALVGLDRLGPGVTGRRRGRFRSKRRRRRFGQRLGGRCNIIGDGHLDTGLLRGGGGLLSFGLVASRNSDNQKRRGHHQNSFHHHLAPVGCLTGPQTDSPASPLRRGP